MPVDVVDRVDPGVAGEVLDFFVGLGLVSGAEDAEVRSLLGPMSPFPDAMREASSVHLHVKVADTAALPDGRIRARGSEPTCCADGYVKYPFPGGVNVIFSSIPVAEDDLLAGAASPSGAVLDHKGIDLRRGTTAARAVFDAVPSVAAGRGWRHRPQGGNGTPVYCCHTEVAAKHWVYPNVDGSGQSRPIEFALGDLVIHEAAMGCDLRPIDPAHPRADEARAALSSCSAAHAAPNSAGVGSSYYDRGDLARFGEMGDHAGALMTKFWSYYNAAIGERAR